MALNRLGITLGEDEKDAVVAAIEAVDKENTNYNKACKTSTANFGMTVSSTQKSTTTAKSSNTQAYVKAIEAHRAYKVKVPKSLHSPFTAIKETYNNDFAEYYSLPWVKQSSVMKCKGFKKIHTQSRNSSFRAGHYTLSFDVLPPKDFGREACMCNNLREQSPHHPGMDTEQHLL